ncbi:Uncharacterised protein [Neisseria gonorrhoeae]|uniref:Uncharacterized protein n=1 Tax=Neisseria gonorrhoeae TaxID=485 RepID=A0A378W0W6_NEIGO|nr:Uncharacterised protein [Neisseria gonorrhoeae]
MLDGMPDKMCAGMADDFDAFLIFRSNDLNSRILNNRVARIDQFAVYLACHRRLRQTGTDRRSNLSHGNGDSYWRTEQSGKVIFNIKRSERLKITA